MTRFCCDHTGTIYHDVTISVLFQGNIKYEFQDSIFYCLLKSSDFEPHFVTCVLVSSCELLRNRVYKICFFSSTDTFRWRGVYTAVIIPRQYRFLQL
ncbi:hypothetical protein FGO68_gene3425 [Halteria grandinella]|uniref:Uncharacterized protein n=1 Tax=Halteria grandinella TaxID=5974 RepID=A0A8J8T4M2_HALGN|nr:hypothetical protein FGO68_gene3425 [Halteria grandinella]